VKRPPPTDAEIAEAVRAYALARLVHVEAKKRYRACRCEVESPAEPDVGHPGDPACYQRRDEMEQLPADACDECKRAEPLLEAARHARERRARALATVERLGLARIVARPFPPPEFDSQWGDRTPPAFDEHDAAPVPGARDDAGDEDGP
jgi:hypothetical protein